MKKIYLLLSMSALTYQLNAQLTLTQASFEPVVGDVSSFVDYDSTSAIPKSTGTNQNWDFSAALSQISGSTSYSSTMVAIASVPEASLFPGATLAEKSGTTTSYNFYKASSSPAQIEFLGIYDPAIVIKYSNPMTQMKWPVAYGNSFNDTFAASLSSSTFTYNMAGSFTTTASGSGNLTLPGGAVYSNVLQLKSVMITTATITVPIFTTVVSISISYLYFHSSGKNPLLNLSYSDGEFSGASIDKRVAVGLTDYNFDASFSIFPNPARTHFNVKLSNPGNLPCTMKLYSATGQLVKTENLGRSGTIENEISIDDLDPGIYMVRTSLGAKTSTRRLVVE